MTVDEITKALNGTYNANKIRANVDGKVEVVATFVGGDLTLTDVGRRAMNRSSAEVVDVVDVKSAKGRKSRGLETTSSDIEPVVELD
jgi:hypothetical protein